MEGYKKVILTKDEGVYFKKGMIGYLSESDNFTINIALIENGLQGINWGTVTIEGKEYILYSSEMLEYEIID